jgi:hypothetical protein
MHPFRPTPSERVAVERAERLPDVPSEIVLPTTKAAGTCGAVEARDIPELGAALMQASALRRGLEDKQVRDGVEISAAIGCKLGHGVLSGWKKQASPAVSMLAAGLV